MTPASADTSSGGGLSDILKRGATMAAIGLAFTQIVTVIQTLVLGRLLGPEQVGLFTAGSIVVGTVAVFAQGTLSQALIQRDHEIEDAANTVLIATLVTGFLLCGAILLSAPLIGIVFHDSRVVPLAAATAGVALLHCCPTVPDALMQRAFQFKRRIIIDPAVSLTFATVSIVFAVMDYGAWAMVIGLYASTVIWVLLSWWMAKWRPFRGRFSFRIWREMAKFSFPLLIDEIGERSREVFEQALVGRSLGTAALGQYRYGYRIATMPANMVIGTCSFILFPAFSRISGDSARFRAAFLRAIGWNWFAALPIAALLLMAGRPLVVLLLGDEWHAAGDASTAMAGIVLGVALTSVGAQAIKGAGRSPLLNWFTGIRLVLSVSLIFLLLPFGLVGVGIAISVSYIVGGLVSIVLARPVVGFTFRETVARLAPTTFSALIALTVVFPLERFLTRSERYAAPVGLAMIVAETLLFAVIYIGALRLISPEWYQSVRDAIGGRLAKGTERALRLVRGSA